MRKEVMRDFLTHIYTNTHILAHYTTKVHKLEGQMLWQVWSVPLTVVFMQLKRHRRSITREAAS